MGIERVVRGGPGGETDTPEGPGTADAIGPAAIAAWTGFRGHLENQMRAGSITANGERALVHHLDVVVFLAVDRGGPSAPRLNALKPHPGQTAVAATQRRLLEGSGIRASHRDCDRVQNPYSFRCQPQVMGACVDLIDNAGRTLLIEANAITENPLVFEERSEVVSGGNFHGQAVAFAADTLALAIAETGSLSERRIAALVTGELSSLPPFLMPDPGLNSGFMLAHVTAAALTSENKQLATPASVDSIPTSANQEDHVSMSAYASRRLAQMNGNTAGILAIEWLAAATGVDLLRPLRSSRTLEQVHALLRAEVPVRTADREFAPDIAAARALIESGVLGKFARELADMAKDP